MTLAVDYNIFYEQKDGNQFHQFEDAFALAGVPVLRIPRNSTRGVVAHDVKTGRLQLPTIWRCAVADGATGSGFSQAWARLLVEQYVNSEVTITPDLGDVRVFIADTATLWNQTMIQEILRGYQPGSMKYIRVKNGLYETTQAAALLLLEVDTVQHTWKAVALGDTLLFKVDGDEKLSPDRPYAHMTGDTFGNNPMLVTTNIEEQNAIIWNSQHFVPEEAYARGSFNMNTDRIFLMTDAIASYYLYFLETYEPIKDHPTREMVDIYKLMLVGRSEEYFNQFVDAKRVRESARGFDKLKNDDVTIMRLRFTDAIADAAPFQLQEIPPLIEPVTDQGVAAPVDPPPVQSAVSTPAGRSKPNDKFPFPVSPSAAAPGDTLPEAQPETMPEQLPPPAPVNVSLTSAQASGSFNVLDDSAVITPAPEAQPSTISPNISAALNSGRPPVALENESFGSTNNMSVQTPAPMPTGRPQVTADFGDTPSEVTVMFNQQNAALERKKLKQASQQRTQQSSNAQPIPTSNNAATMPASRKKARFEVHTQSNIIAINDEILRIIDKVVAWDNSNFSKTDLQTNDLRATVTGVWKNFGKDDVYKWMSDIADSPIHGERRKWEQKIRAQVRLTIEDLIHRRASADSCFYLLLILIVTWDGFQYLSGMVDIELPTHANKSNTDANLEVDIKARKIEFERLWDEFKRSGGKVFPEWIRDFWKLANEYAVGAATRCAMMDEIAKINLKQKL